MALARRGIGIAVSLSGLLLTGCTSGGTGAPEEQKLRDITKFAESKAAAISLGTPTERLPVSANSETPASIDLIWQQNPITQAEFASRAKRLGQHDVRWLHASCSEKGSWIMSGTVNVPTEMGTPAGNVWPADLQLATSRDPSAHIGRAGPYLQLHISVDRGFPNPSASLPVIRDASCGPELRALVADVPLP